MYWQAERVLALCPEPELTVAKRREIELHKRARSMPRTIHHIEDWSPRNSLEAYFLKHVRRHLEPYTKLTNQLRSLPGVTEASYIQSKADIRVAAVSSYWGQQLGLAVNSVLSFCVGAAILVFLFAAPSLVEGISRELDPASFGEYGAAYTIALFFGLMLLVSALDYIPGREGYLLTLVLSAYVAIFYALTFRANVMNIAPSIRLGVASALALITGSVAAFVLLGALRTQVLRAITNRNRAVYIDEFSLVSFLGLLNAIRQVKE
nr:hypothetical protein [Micromonospora sp. DSM 115978]